MTVVPLFPPGVHDIVTNDLGEGLTEFVCVSCDFAGGLIAHTDNVVEMRIARRLAYRHAREHRRRPCHDACLEEPECLYGGGGG